jgi:hypothetical protein
MVIRAAAAAAGFVGGTATAASNGGPDLVGIAAIITSLVGAATLAWTIYQASRRSAKDAEIAADVIQVLERRKREGRLDAQE